MTTLRISQRVTVSRTGMVCAAIFVLSLALFLVGIDSPSYPYFDEVHYLPAARDLLGSHQSDQPALNREHPPLGKELIAAGIALWGDNPFGWRFMSAVFGAVALVACFLWALALFEDVAPALWATTITLADQFLYVQARIATLDVFVAAFTMCGLAAFTASWKSGASVRPLMAATGIFLGLATASKWTGLLAIALWLGLVAAVAVMRGWRVRFENPSSTDWFRQDLWMDMRTRDWVLCILAPVLIYVATFLPTTGASVSDFLRRQVDMWRDQVSLSTAAHPYASAWTSWPLLARPIWYLFEPASSRPGAFQAVVFLGNPAVLWCGILAVLFCAAAFVRGRRKDALLLASSYGVLYLAWTVVPRGAGFLYYYFPAGLVIGPALAFVFYRTALSRYPAARWLYLAAALALFGYFLPISSAAVTVTLPRYNDLMWFRSWR